MAISTPSKRPLNAPNILPSLQRVVDGDADFLDPFRCTAWLATSPLIDRFATCRSIERCFALAHPPRLDLRERVYCLSWNKVVHLRRIEFWFRSTRDEVVPSMLMRLRWFPQGDVDIHRWDGVVNLPPRWERRKLSIRSNHVVPDDDPCLRDGFTWA